MTHNQPSQALRLSFEYFPSSNDTADERLWRAVARHSVFNPEFVSITYGAGGSQQNRTLKTLKRIKERSPLNAAGHLTIVGHSRDEVMDVAKSYRALGVDHIVALRGDKRLNEPNFMPFKDGFKNSLELIEALKERDFDISVAAYPETHPEAMNEDADIQYLTQKFDAGADRAITQFFFEKDHFLRFRDKIAGLGIEKPVIPGILPIENFQKVKNFANKCGAHIPPWLEHAFANAQTREDQHLLAVSIACDMIENLRAEGADHVHIYTLNNPDLVFDVCTALGCATQSSTIVENMAINKECVA